MIFRNKIKFVRNMPKNLCRSVITNQNYYQKQQKSEQALSTDTSRLSFASESLLKSLIIHRQEPAVKHQEKLQTLCTVTLLYCGRNLRLESYAYEKNDEIIVEQQHCGGNTLPVFRGYVASNSKKLYLIYYH